MKLDVGLIVMGILVIVILAVFLCAKRLEKARTEKAETDAEVGTAKPKSKKTKQTGKAEDLLGFITIEQGILTLRHHKGICAIIGVDALHYASLSPTEQETVDGAQASMLASLSFPIQTVSITKPVDLTHYIQRLKDFTTTGMSDALEQYAKEHIRYLEEETKREILIKGDHLVVGVADIEDGEKAKNELDRRCGLVISALRRAGHLARVLDTEEAAAIFYDIFHANRVMTARLQDAFEEGDPSFYVHRDPPAFQTIHPSESVQESTHSDNKRFVMLR